MLFRSGPEGLSFVDLPISSPDLPKQVREFEQLRVSDFAQEHFPGIQAQCYAELGEAGSVIHDIVKRDGCDLVMLPTHGRGPVRRLMLGSVTTKVLHDIGCAVWTATSTAAKAGHDGKYTSVVAAVDDSQEGLSVMKAADEIGRAHV